MFIPPTITQMEQDMEAVHTLEREGTRIVEDALQALNAVAPIERCPFDCPAFQNKGDCKHVMIAFPEEIA